MYFTNYYSNFVFNDISTSFIDPCNTMYFKFDTELRDFALDETNPLVEYMVALPELELKFQAVNVIYDLTEDYTDKSYCGTTQYNVTFQDGSALNSSIFTFT